MRDMNEIDKILEKKYKEIKIPDEMFDTSKVFKRIEKYKKRRRKVIRYACLLVILLIGSVVILSLTLNNNDNSGNSSPIVNSVTEENDADDEAKNTHNNENIVIAGDITIKNLIIKYDRASSDYVSVIEVKEILGYEIIDGIPSTRVKANVVRNYLNDLEGEVEMIIPGGTFMVKELKDKLDIEEGEITLYKDNQYVKVTCDGDYYMSSVEPNKKYVTTTYEKDGVLYICSDLKYGFREYDEKTNTVKDYDDKNVEVDMENYLKGK